MAKSRCRRLSMADAVPIVSSDYTLSNDAAQMLEQPRWRRHTRFTKRAAAISLGAALLLLLLVMVALLPLLISPHQLTCSDPLKNKSETCANFVEMKSPCNKELWVGVLKDAFSPDDVCPNSTRFIDVRGGQLQVSASHTGALPACSETWGRRFHPASSINPVIHPHGSERDGSCALAVSFISKVPPNAPAYPLAHRGALNFTLTLGQACGRLVLRWNGVYDGRGGEWPQGQVSQPSACDNFWIYR